MAVRKKPTTRKRRASPSSKILDSITGSDALSLLKLLAERDEEFAELIDATGRELLAKVNSEEVATEVQIALESLGVEEVWDDAGATRDGYVDPGDTAWQMFEDALNPFEATIEKYRRLSMTTEARSYCEGMLRGIYDFHKESSSEYKDWAVDAPSEFFGQILEIWRSLFKGRAPIPEMERFLRSYCPEWSEWSLRMLRKRRR